MDVRLMPATVATGFAPERLKPLFDNDGDHDERGQRIGPPPVEKGIEGQATQKNGG